MRDNPNYSYISTIVTPDSQTHFIKDAEARDAISSLETSITGAMHYIGVTTTPLEDESTTNPIIIGGQSVTAVSGDVVIYGDREFAFSSTDSMWHEFGSTGSLKAMAFADTASGTYTPSGTVSSSFTGDTASVSITATPTGTVSQPTITITPTTSSFATSVQSATATTTANSLSVSNETLIISAATVTPTVTLNTSSAMTGATATSTQPTFTGNEISTSASVAVSGTVTSTFAGTTGTITVAP